MCALSPAPFPNSGWPFDEDPLSHQHNYMYGDTTDASIEDLWPLICPLTQPQVQLNRSTSFSANSGDPNMAKKLYHNASERDRRKKMNTLYSSLRSLLPAVDQTKKLSIPTTVSRVVKYIPELQQQVEKLEEKKEDLISTICKKSDIVHHQQQQQEQQRRSVAVEGSLSCITANRLNDTEILIQISTYKPHKCPLSEILLTLKDDGLLLMNASSSESFGGRVFYSLHLQVEGTNELKCEVVSEKLKSMY